MQRANSRSIANKANPYIRVLSFSSPVFGTVFHSSTMRNLKIMACFSNDARELKTVFRITHDFTVPSMVSGDFS